jgi:hypothetical protein
VRIRRAFAATAALVVLGSACARPTSTFALTKDPLAAYTVPPVSGTQSELTTLCMPDDDAPVASWTVKPTGDSPTDLIADIEAYALAHDWARSDTRPSSADQVYLVKDPTAVAEAGGRDDEEVSGTISLEGDGLVYVSLMAHLRCP